MIFLFFVFVILQALLKGEEGTFVKYSDLENPTCGVGGITLNLRVKL